MFHDFHLYAKWEFKSFYDNKQRHNYFTTEEAYGFYALMLVHINEFVVKCCCLLFSFNWWIIGDKKITPLKMLYIFTHMVKLNFNNRCFFYFLSYHKVNKTDKSVLAKSIESSVLNHGELLTVDVVYIDRFFYLQQLKQLPRNLANFS